MPNSVNYVKFQRGTIAAYNALKTRELIDSNTLYFIYESADKKNGYLYLGDKLIGGSGSDSTITKLPSIYLNLKFRKYLSLSSFAPAEPEWFSIRERICKVKKKQGNYPNFVAIFALFIKNDEQ